MEKKEEREGGVPWRDNDLLLRVVLEQSGENEELEGKYSKEGKFCNS